MNVNPWPSTKTISGMSPGDETTLAGSFVNLLQTGEVIATATLSSEPAGFTFGTPVIDGPQVIFETTAPTVSGWYLLNTTITTTGVPNPQTLTRGISLPVTAM